MLVKERMESNLSLDNPHQDSLKLVETWQNLTEDSCPQQFNFHLHTNCSDGQLSPESLIEQATSLGLKGLAITDHHTVKGFWRAKKWLKNRKKSLDHSSDHVFPHLWTGIEITSTFNSKLVHILGYGFNPEAQSLSQYLTGEEPRGKLAEGKNVIEAIHQAGGLAVLAHPFRYRYPAQELMMDAYQSGVDGLETYYAYRKSRPWKAGKKESVRVKQMADKYNLYTTCGTDSHGNNILIRI